MSQEAVALDAGIALATLSYIERGSQNPTWGTVRKLADALGVKVSEIALRAEQDGSAD